MRIVVVSPDYLAGLGLTKLLSDGGAQAVGFFKEIDPSNVAESGVPDCIVIYAGDLHPSTFLPLFEWAADIARPTLLIFARLRRLWVEQADQLGVAAVLAADEVPDQLCGLVDCLANAEATESVGRDRSFVDGGPSLSARESETLAMYVTGMKLACIGRTLNVSEATVRTYLARIREKYEAAGRPARTRLELRSEAIRDGLVSEA